MRHLNAPIACVLALVTGAWIGQAYTLFAPLEPVEEMDASSRRAVATVWRFYDAIDIILRTGDDAALRGGVAPDFVDHAGLTGHTDQAGASSGRDELLRYLASLRVTLPALRLVPEDVIGHGDRAVARLGPISGTEGAILGIVLAGAPPWPQIDTVRVRGDRIAERWSERAAYASSSPLVSESLTSTHSGDLAPFLQRVRFTPGARDQTFGQRGPAIISVEEGTLDVAMVDAQAFSSPATSQSPRSTPIGPGRVHTLGPGGTLVVPEQMAFEAGNRAGAAAAMLLITLVQPTRRPVNLGPITGALIPAGITAQALSGNSAHMPNPGRVTAELARVTLPPGMRLAVHEVAGAELVAVDAGMLTATIAGDTFSAWLQDPNGRSVLLRPYGQVGAGFGVSTFGKGALVGYRNETGLPVTLLLLTLAGG